MLSTISSLLIPILVLIVIIYGIYKKVDIYDVFIEGAKESFDLILKIFLSLLAMIFAVNLFLRSGVLTFVFSKLDFIFNYLHIPTEVISLALIRPISSSSSLAILNNIYQTYGPDSFTSLLASVIQGSTDTTFYIIAMYFGSIGVKKIKYAMWAGLFADLMGLIASIIIANIIF